MVLMDDYQVKVRLDLYRQFKFGGESFLIECRDDLKFMARFHMDFGIFLRFRIEGFIQDRVEFKFILARVMSGFVIEMFGVKRPLMVCFNGGRAGCGRLLVVSVCVVKYGGS